MGVDVQTIIEFRYVFVRADASVITSPSPGSSTYLSTSSRKTLHAGVEQRSDADLAEPSIRFTPEESAMLIALFDLSGLSCREASSSNPQHSVRNGFKRFLASFCALLLLSKIKRLVSRLYCIIHPMKFSIAVVFEA